MGGSGFPPPVGQPPNQSDPQTSLAIMQKYHQMVQADQLIETQIKVLSALYDKSSAYTNLVMLAGYAAYFGIWGYVRDHLTPLTELSAALCMAVSAGTFVFFEVVKMIFTATTLKGPTDAVFDKTIRDNPQAIRLRLIALGKTSERANVRFQRFWLVQLGVAVSMALLGLGILLYGLIYGLILSYREYP